MHTRAFWLPLVAGSFLLLGETAVAGNPYVVIPRDVSSMPAVVYASMTADQCIEALERAQVVFQRLERAEGVDAPVRIVEPMHGVAFTHLRAGAKGRRATGSIMDCRLVLALDGLSQALASRGVVEVGFINAYRPDPSAAVVPGTRHPSALAVDVAWFKKRDGSRLDIERDFGGKVGAKTCGVGAHHPNPPSEQAQELRIFVCEDAGASRLFNLVLTPNYDELHHNHVHLEVRRGVGWFLVQ